MKLNKCIELVVQFCGIKNRFREMRMEEGEGKCVLAAQKPIRDRISQKFKQNAVAISATSVACWQSFSRLLSFFRTWIG